MIKCSKCGAELRNDAKFCSLCGTKIESSDSDTNAPAVLKNAKQSDPDTELIGESELSGEYVSDTNNENSQDIHTSPMLDEALDNRLKAKLLTFWHGLDLFCKIAAVSISVGIILFLVSISTKNGLAIFFSVIQLGGALVAVLLHKGLFKPKRKVSRIQRGFERYVLHKAPIEPEQKKWIKYFALGVAMICAVLNVMSYSWMQRNHENASLSSDSEKPVVSTVTVPFEAAECAGADYEAIESEFRSAGFTSVEMEKIEDLNAEDSNQVGTVESVSIGGETDFAEGQKFDSTDTVLIRYHVYEKFAVTIHVEFIQNLIFSQYDVNLLVDDAKEGSLPHGEDQDFELNLDVGKHTLTFESDEDSSVTGKTTLTIDCDTDAAYRISCHSEEISVEELYIDRLTELAEGESKLDVSATDYIGKNYRDVESALESLGFTDIQYQILYDIVLGLTDEGTVDSVSIAGTDDFRRGDIFASDSEVIITYHMKEEDDPSKPAETTDNTGTESGNAEADEASKDTEQEENLTVDNCEDLKNLLAVKDPFDSSVGDFASKYNGKIIEFDGCTVNCMQHENYTTRFDYLLSAGDYDPDHQIGPYFKFEDVNHSDLHTDLDTVGEGINVHIIAEVVSYNSSNGWFKLEPVSVTGR